MLKFRRPPSNFPDYKIVLAAAYAEAFNRAAKAAGTTMTALGQSGGTFGVLKTNGGAYMAGPFNFETMLVEGAAVDDLASLKVPLDVDQITIAELKKQLTGHVRVALTEATKAVNTQSIHLIFFDGGPLIIVRDEGQGQEYATTPYRIALVRFEDAASMTEEAECVRANKTSEHAYRYLWNYLEELAQKEAAQSPAAARDVLDEEGEYLGDMDERPRTVAPRPIPTPSPPAAPAPDPIPDAPSNLEDEEDLIDDIVTFGAPPVTIDEPATVEAPIEMEAPGEELPTQPQSDPIPAGASDAQPEEDFPF